MERLEHMRLEWQRAQAALQSALADLETLVAADTPDAGSIAKARARVADRQEAADLHLQRYITQIGKS